MECGSYLPFTCEHACARLGTNLLDAEQLPANVTCRQQGAKSQLFTRLSIVANKNAAFHTTCTLQHSLKWLYINIHTLRQQSESLELQSGRL